MKLSIAMLMGDTLRKRDAEHWLTEDGSCGCAMGGALLAVSGTAKDLKQPRACAWSSPVTFFRRWPWLTETELINISGQFNRVVDGDATFESLVDYVRSIEPECGECCQFDCACKVAGVEASQEAVTV